MSGPDGIQATVQLSRELLQSGNHQAALASYEQAIHQVNQLRPILQSNTYCYIYSVTDSCLWHYLLDSSVG
jgi:hypothetical protein